MPRYPQLQDGEWLREQVATKPLRQIAEEVGCTYGAIQHQIKLHGIEVPRRWTRRPSATRSESIKASLAMKYPEGRTGELAANWRGGRREHAGYVEIYAPDHPRARGGAVFEHILVMEEQLGRYLQPGEIVHHVNEIRDDNRPENLEVKTRSEHVKEHYGSGTSLRLRVEQLEERVARLEAAHSIEEQDQSK